MLDGKCVKFVSEHKHKYLGVITSNDLSDSVDMKRQIKSVYSCGNYLINQFRHCSEDINVKLLKTYCSSFYGSNL